MKLAIGLIFVYLVMPPTHGRCQIPRHVEKPQNGSTSGENIVFDVISVKPSNANGSNVWFLPDGFVLKGVSGQVLLTEAFHVQRTQIIGAPQWVSARSWDIQAKVAEADIPTFANLTFDHKRAMLQQVLRDRFSLRYHREVRKLSVYVLKVDTGRPILRIADPPVAEPVVVRPGHFAMKSTALETLASVLSGQLNQIVVNKTGLVGLYDIKLDWTPESALEANEDSSQRRSPDSAVSNEPLPTLFTAIREQLGLRLVHEKEPVEVIVIDNLDKPAAD